MARKSTTYAVGIDLGTTYSCLSYLTPQGNPQTLPNAEGELSTPSVVFFDGEDVVVGTEALRNSITHPDNVVMHAKRHMGDPQKRWLIGGQVYTPIEISAMIVRKLLEGAEAHLGGEIKRAVITVPAQFSEIQRQWTVEAGKKAGLDHVDIINEPVAAALCHVLGEGMWFAEIANNQTVLVFDLGGGTFDLSLVTYNRNEVRVKASGGDLHLGGLDWNLALEKFTAEQFERETGLDPRLDRESMQSLALEIEQVKRALSVRPKASLMLQHAGRRKTYGMTREQFEELTKPLVKRLEHITLGMLKVHKLGWRNVDSVLVTGGSSRMPMVRDMLNRISGTTLNTTLSPDQSISHGAAFYAGMLLSGQSLATSSLNKEATAKLAQVKQQSVNARSLGILVRDMESGKRVPHYLIPANSPLPTAFRQQFGTVVPNQNRVHLHIVESGTSEEDAPVELGACVVDGLPKKLPLGSPIEVTIRYDEQARVHVEAKDVVSGKTARTTIVRNENLTEADQDEHSSADLVSSSSPAPAPTKPSNPQPAATKAVAPPVAKPAPPPKAPAVPMAARTVKPTAAAPVPAATAKKSTFVPSPGAAAPPPVKKPAPTAASGKPPQVRTSVPLEQAERPVPLCNHCGEPLDPRGICPGCRPGAKAGLKQQPPTTPKARKPARPNS